MKEYIEKNKGQCDRVKILLYALPAILIFTLYLIGFYPGLITSDVFDQLKQIQVGQYNDWHPVMHTFFISVIIKIFGLKPAVIVFIQILMVSLSFGYGMYSLDKNGINRYLLIVCSILFAIFPPNGFMVVNIWKDIPYAAFILLFTICIINIVITDGVWLDFKLNLSILFISGLGLIFLRHNGLVPFVVTFLVLFVFYKRYLKQTCIIFISVMLIYIIVKIPIYNMIGVIPIQKSEVFGVPMNGIASVIKYDGYMTDTQKKEANEYLPLDLWKKNYNPYSTNAIKFDKNFNIQLLLDNKFKFINLWLELFRQNPKIVFTAYAKQTSLLWQVPYPKDGYIFTIESEITQNSFGLENIKIAPKISALCDKVYSFIYEKNIIWLFWRPALQLYISLIILIILAIKRNIKFLIIGIPLIMNISALFLAMPAQDYRYFWGNVLIFFLILPLFKLCFTSKKP